MVATPFTEIRQSGRSLTLPFLVIASLSFLFGFLGFLALT